MMNQRNLEPTRILDFNSPETCRFAESIAPQDDSPDGFLRACEDIERDSADLYRKGRSTSLCNYCEETRFCVDGDWRGVEAIYGHQDTLYCGSQDFTAGCSVLDWRESDVM
jgi:hypothetical protein